MQRNKELRKTCTLAATTTIIIMARTAQQTMSIPTASSQALEAMRLSPKPGQLTATPPPIPSIKTNSPGLSPHSPGLRQREAHAQTTSRTRAGTGFLTPLPLFLAHAPSRTSFRSGAGCRADRVEA
ncbi:hypothetical protein BU24DRAFT_406954 [Aaosphaeria arxii CBS 175.79]|uniref:Uncharacterized protein n=1 Tax=Aaosphaeria arxii CBS 175.79 TaxID=1450172 RepID=A0A6A5XX57_9PLEO|nr:uncharacterized protein BU24DRAFT_406954 [Aaosphaeria arxii CBS 175.79]KAF2016854.1 hypothetical protein BU24DRAFT_406954 [Aaosphaeria arxii CBS 175.79]